MDGRPSETADAAQAASAAFGAAWIRGEHVDKLAQRTRFWGFIVRDGAAGWWRRVPKTERADGRAGLGCSCEKTVSRAAPFASQQQSKPAAAGVAINTQQEGFGPHPLR
jgi:hypothetical protein